MPSGRSTNTMVEALQNVLRDISQMKTMPDANLEFLVDLETMILAFLRKPIEDYMQKYGQAPPPESQALPAEQPTPPMGGPSFTGQGVPGVMTGTGGKIPFEELNRLLSR